MAIIFNNKKKKAKVQRDHSYAGFWLDRGAADVSYGGRSQASSVVKAIKLRNYQKAIGNFVKILSQKDVPVYFKGTESYTDFNHVVIAGNINEKNFDVTAGLALHEASHLKHTQKNVLTDFVNNYEGEYRRANRLLDQIEPKYRGKPQAERVIFFLADSYFSHFWCDPYSFSKFVSRKNSVSFIVTICFVHFANK